MAKRKLYSIGYGALDPVKLLGTTMILNATLFDVRAYPSGRVKRGFSKLELSTLFADRYQWHGNTLGGLGRTTKPEGIAAIKRQLRTTSVILMCAEDDPFQCHRYETICKCHFPNAAHIYDGWLFTTKALLRCEADPDPAAEPSALRSLDDEIAAVKTSA